MGSIGLWLLAVAMAFVIGWMRGNWAGTIQAEQRTDKARKGRSAWAA